MRRRAADPRLLDEAEVPTLGLMVFGGSILVGVVLLALFANLSSNLQQQTSVAAGRATDSLLTTVDIRSVTMHRDGLMVDRVSVLITPAPGAPPFPLNQLALQLVTARDTVGFAPGGPRDLHVDAVSDSEPLMNATAPVVSRGDLVQLDIDPAAARVVLPPRTDVTFIVLVPGGRAAHVVVNVPASNDGSNLLGWEV